VRRGRELRDAFLVGITAGTMAAALMLAVDYLTGR
jgi:hypothetical protein